MVPRDPRPRDRLWPAMLLSVVVHASLIFLVTARNSGAPAGVRTSGSAPAVAMQPERLFFVELRSVPEVDPLARLRVPAPSNEPRDTTAAPHDPASEPASSTRPSSAIASGGDGGDGDDQGWIRVPGGFVRSGPAEPGTQTVSGLAELEYLSEAARVLRAACAVDEAAVAAAGNATIALVVSLEPDGRIASWHFEGDVPPEGLGLDRALREVRLPAPPRSVFERYRSSGIRVILRPPQRSVPGSVPRP